MSGKRERLAGYRCTQHGDRCVCAFTYVGSIGSQDKCIRTHSACRTQRDSCTCAYMCAASSSPPAPRSTMPIITYRPRSIPLLADSSRCCLIHATPRFHGGLLVLSRRGRVGFFGAQWAAGAGVDFPWRVRGERVPHTSGGGIPLFVRQFLFARATFPSSLPLPPFQAPCIFTPASFLRQRRLRLGAISSPSATGKALRAALLLPKGKMHGFIGGKEGRLQQSLRLAMLFGNVYSKRWCNRIFPIVDTENVGVVSEVKSGWRITVAVHDTLKRFNRVLRYMYYVICINYVSYTQIMNVKLYICKTCFWRNQRVFFLYLLLAPLKRK